MLTISQLAQFVGVTVRAVRHYHARGLLPEPVRDVSGYRRYNSQAVIDLIRIKTLADAGVPLSRIRQLLQSDPHEFTQAVEQINRQLHERIQALKASRERIQRLAAGDSLVLPDDVLAYLTHLRTLGFSERSIAMERDAWIVLAAQAPDRVTDWIAQKQHLLNDPHLRDLYLDFDRAYDWPPDDPRLARLARAMQVVLAQGSPQTDGVMSAGDADLDGTLIAMIEAETIKASPAWQRLIELLHQQDTR